MHRNLLASTLISAILAACAASPPTGPEQGPRPYTAVTARTEGPDLGAIDRFGIPVGRCGMILYTQSGASPVPIFRSTDDGTALMEIDGVLMAFLLVGRGGDTRMNIPSSQYFRTPEGSPPVSVAVQTRWGSSFPAGAYVEDGTVTIFAADGWARVVPVAGISGCRS